MKPSYGICVGRFQVNDLHDGHMELFRQVRARHNAVIVFVGCTPSGLSTEDPLDFPTRKAMIQGKFPEFTVLPLKDTRNDQSWSRQLDKRIEEVVPYGEVTLYGGRDSFVPHYKGRHIPLELSLPIETLRRSGTVVRAECSNRVMESADFRAGMIYAQNHIWPSVVMCVDAAIMCGDDLLLGRKPGETQWRFVGGHVDVVETLEDAVRREVMEESGVDALSIKYVASSWINDWRYEKSDNKIATALFLVKAMSHSTRAGDDIEQVQWFTARKVAAPMLVPEHGVLLKALHKHLEENNDTAI